MEPARRDIFGRRRGAEGQRCLLLLPPGIVFWDYPTIERVAAYLAAVKSGSLAA